MDTSNEWTATALFSPSKARVQQAQARDWAAVDSWLSKKYPSRRPPDFERNEDTLQALLTLANFNESADERKIQIERVEKAALQSISRSSNGFADDILSSFSSAGSAYRKDLDTLAEAAVALDCPAVDVTAIGVAIVGLTTAAFSMEQQFQWADAQLSALQSEQGRIKLILQELQGEEVQPPNETAQNTTEWTRTAKNLKTKIAEYDERLSGVRPSSSSDVVLAVSVKAAEVAQQRIQLHGLEANVKAFQDLPPETRAAKAKLEGAREKLIHLLERRDGLFENLVDSG